LQKKPIAAETLKQSAALKLQKTEDCALHNAMHKTTSGILGSLLNSLKNRNNKTQRSEKLSCRISTNACKVTGHTEKSICGLAYSKFNTTQYAWKLEFLNTFLEDVLILILKTCRTA
jgi:hypothetical protein